MTSDPYEELPPAKRRRLMTRAALRGLLVTTLLVVLYYQLPLHQRWGGDAAVRVLAGLLVFAGLAAWQVRAVTGSRYPQVKAVEVLALHDLTGIAREGAPRAGRARRSRSPSSSARHHRGT